MRRKPSTPPERRPLLPPVVSCALLGVFLSFSHASATGLILVPGGYSLMWLAMSLSLSVLCVILYALWRQRMDARSLARGLRESEHLLAAVADANPALLWISDTEGRCVWANARWLGFTGLSDTSVLGDGWLSAIADDERESVRDLLLEGIATETPRASTFSMLRHDGATRQMVVEGSPRHDTAGNFTGYCLSCLDVTELVETRRALADSERSFRTLVANIPGAVYRSESKPPWHMHFLSDGAELITGISPRRFMDRSLTWESVVHPDDRANLNDPVLEACNTPDGHYTLSYRILTARGEIRHVMEHGRPVMDESGNLLYLDGVIFDITDQQRISDALRSMRDFLHDVLEAMPSALVGFSPSGLVMQWNRVAEEMTGIPPEDALDMTAAEVVRVLAGDNAEVRASLEDRNPGLFPRIAVLRGDDLRHVDVQVFTAGAGHEALVMRVDDITRRTRLEEALIQSEKMLSVGGLAAGMAHEINNPLGAILQGVQNIQRRFGPELDANREAAAAAGCTLENITAYLAARNIDTFLDGIRTAGARAAAIVASMLEFSRPSQGKRSAASIHETIERALVFASSDYDLKKKYDFKRIEITRAYDTADDTVICSSTEIEQVLLNLLRNAAQAMGEKDYPPGQGPVLRISTRVDPDHVTVDVVDNGPGITPDARRRIFEPFYSTKAPGMGTGLGLSIAYFIITNNHGGAIECASQPGAGTRFTLRLPRDGGA